MYSTKKAIFPVDSFPRFSEMDFKIAVITTTITIPAIDVIAFLKSCPNKLRQNFNILLLSNLPFNAFVKISEISKSSSSTYFWESLKKTLIPNLLFSSLTLEIKSLLSASAEFSPMLLSLVPLAAIHPFPVKNITIVPKISIFFIYLSTFYSPLV